MNKIYQSPRLSIMAEDCRKAKDKAKDLGPEDKDLWPWTRTRTQLFVLKAPRGHRQVLEDTPLFSYMVLLLNLAAYWQHSLLQITDLKDSIV